VGDDPRDDRGGVVALGEDRGALDHISARRVRSRQAAYDCANGLVTLQALPGTGDIIERCHAVRPAGLRQAADRDSASSASASAQPMRSISCAATAKLNVRDRAQAVIAAHESGLVQAGAR
jgi:hypothetical protein